MPAPQVMINGQAYSWANVKVIIFGIPIAGITNISYLQNQKTTNNYGAGDLPVSFARGNMEFTGGKITLYKEEVLALCKSAPENNLMRLPLTSIIVTMSGDAVTFVTEIVNNVRFTSNPMTVKQGDTSIMCDVSFDFAGVDLKL